MNTLLIESNRQLAKQKINNNVYLSETSTEHTIQESRASWTTNIDSGIELNVGDQISMEACALNIVGAGSDAFQQFTGKVQQPEPNGTFRTDNSVEIEIAYYTTNNIEFNFPLPSGKHMVELNICMQGEYGAPAFNGRHLWRSHYPTFNSATIHTDYTMLPNTSLDHVYLQKDPTKNGPKFFCQNNGGYYFIGMNTDVDIPKARAAVPTPAPEPFFAQGMADACAYHSWCALTPYVGLPGVQFGQSDGPLLPLDTAPFYQTTPANPQTTSTLNMNVDIKNKFTNSGYFINGQNGGANPLLLLPGSMVVNPKITPFGYALNNGYLCQDLTDWDAVGPGAYRYYPSEDASTYKGSYLNENPNGNRLFQPKKDLPSDYCRGPYYNAEFNYLLSDFTTPGDPDMNGLLNFNGASSISNRNEAYWKMQTETIRIDLKTGNITPSRICEITTETFKQRHGNADDPTEKFFQQKVYSPRVSENRTSTPDDLIEETLGGISSKSYSTFPTLVGSCLSAAKQVSSKGLGQDDGWDCLNEDNIPLSALEDPSSKHTIGENISENQMKLQYWSNQLCGNPYHWKCVTKLLPMAQYHPFIDSEVLLANFRYQNYSIYTGTTQITDPNFPLNSQRRQANGGYTNVKIGEYGDMPCLLETPRSGESTIEDVAYRGLFFLTEVTALGQPIPNPNTDPFRINSRPYGIWSDKADAKKYKTFAPVDRDIILTSIIFNGQLRNDLLNDECTHLAGHNTTTGTSNTLSSQSNTFFDNTFVEWKLGRLNDQMTYPEQYIDYDFALKKDNYGQKGVAQYLPNMFQTNYMFKNNPNNGWDGTQSQNTIDNILSVASHPAPLPATAGTYSFCALKCGIYNKNNAPGYITTAGYNPQAFYEPDVTGSYSSYEFGPACWGTFRGEYLNDVENKTGFEKVCDRKFRAYRYLPQERKVNPDTGVEYSYTAIDAWNKLIYTGLDPLKWSTRPATMSFVNFQELWNTITILNNGKGVGWIPIFSCQSTKTNEFNNVPFLGVIHQAHDYEGQFPLPEGGEFIFLGSTPSLTQNDLHLPASTQQRFKEEYKSGSVGINLPQASPAQPLGEVVFNYYNNMRSSSWATSSYCGTNDPLWVFDNVLNRYSYSKLHTELFKGNGRFQYGNSGGATDPDSSEVAVSNRSAAFSKQLTIPPGYIGILGPGTHGGTLQEMLYLENIEGNTIWDRTNPGGYGPAAADTNAQYGSPLAGTQYEAKYMPYAYIQSNINASFPSNPNTSGTIIGPNQDELFTDFLVPPSLRPFAYVKTEQLPYVTTSAQSGISFTGLSIPITDGSVIKLASTDYIKYQGTLLDKLGFTLNQFLPLFGQVQTQLNHSLFNKYSGPDADAGLAYHNLVKPITTQAIISTSLTPALGNVFGITPETVPITAPVDLPLPSYSLGMIIGEASTNGSSESIFAVNLPSKAQYPYLVCRTNILPNMQYVGGQNGQQLLPAISYIMTDYSVGDFSFSQRSDLTFTVTRPYILTEIRTQIHLPDGQLADAILDDNSAVIYRVDKVQIKPTPEEQPPKKSVKKR